MPDSADLCRSPGCDAAKGEEGSPAPTRLLSFNALWKQDGSPILPGFLDAVRAAKQAEVADLDFRTAQGREEAGKRINGWAAQKTEGKITEIIDPSSSPCALASS